MGVRAQGMIKGGCSPGGPRGGCLQSAAELESTCDGAPAVPPPHGIPDVVRAAGNVDAADHEHREGRHQDLPEDKEELPGQEERGERAPHQPARVLPQQREDDKRRQAELPRLSRGGQRQRARADAASLGERAGRGAQRIGRAHVVCAAERRAAPRRHDGRAGARHGLEKKMVLPCLTKTKRVLFCDSF
eukprot:scaffold4236_cov79-Isochrysis_galbana.AAC.2